MSDRKNAVAREIEIGEKFVLRDEVETVFETNIKSHGDSARAGVPKKWRGKRAYVVVLKE